jgi:hypothetical protein
MFVCCGCCALSARSLCDEPITRPEESRSPTECGVSECDREASAMRKSRHPRGFRAMGGGGNLQLK